jgi:serine/threonine protein kinase
MLTRQESSVSSVVTCLDKKRASELTDTVLSHVKGRELIKPFEVGELTFEIQSFYKGVADGPESRPGYHSMFQNIRDILDDKDGDSESKSYLIVKKVDGLYCSSGWHLRPEEAASHDDSGCYDDTSGSQQHPRSGQPNPVFSLPSQKKRPSSGSVNESSRPTKSQKIQCGAQVPSSQTHSHHEHQPIGNSSTSRIFKCYDCGKEKFDTFEKLERHDYTHHPHEVFICPFINDDGKRCHHMKTRKDNFRKHSLTEHDIDLSLPGNQWYKKGLEYNVHQIHDRSHRVCPFCGKDLHNREESRHHVLEHQKNEHPKELDRVFKHCCPDPFCGEKDHWKSSKDIPQPFRRQQERKSKPPMPDETDGEDSDDDGENQEGSNLWESPSSGWTGGNGTGTDQGNNGNSSSERDPNGGSRYTLGPSYRYQCQYQSEEASVLRLHRNSLRKSNVHHRLNHPLSDSLFTGVKCGNKTRPLFESVRELGQGSFGVVDEVFCIPTMQTYARKITPFPHTSSSDVMSEQKILQRLNHQHIIKFVGFYAAGSSVWLMTSPAAESDLAVYLRRIGPEGPVFRKPGKLYRHLLRKWTGCLLSALEHLHDNRIVHGDIKPKNILVFSNQVYLADFGTAKDYGSANYSEGMPRTGARKASGVTPKYCAPEVSVSMAFSHVWSQAAAADIFSLGCVFAEMATVYAGQSIQAFENFRLSGNGEIAFHANIRRTCWWMDTLSITEEPDSCVSLYKFLQTVKDMLSFDPLQRPTAKELTSRLRCTCSDMSSKRQDYGLPSWLWSDWPDPKRHDNSSQHGLCHDSSATLKYGTRASSYFNVPSPFRYDQTMPCWWPIWGVNCRSLRVMNSPAPKLLESYPIDDRATPCIIQKATFAGGYLSLLFNITVGPIYVNLSPYNSQV